MRSRPSGYGEAICADRTIAAARRGLDGANARSELRWMQGVAIFATRRCGGNPRSHAGVGYSGAGATLAPVTLRRLQDMSREPRQARTDKIADRALPSRSRLHGLPG